MLNSLVILVLRKGYLVGFNQFMKHLQAMGTGIYFKESKVIILKDIMTAIYNKYRNVALII